MTKAKVIDALQRNDAQTLKRFYNLHRGAFIAFAQKYPLDKDTVLDIYQDAIIAFREQAIKGNLDSLKSELKTYLFSIGKYMIYDKLKYQQKVHLVSDIGDNLQYFDNHLINDLTEEQKQLRIAFKGLGEKCKSILTLFYYRGFDLEDIMIDLNYSNKDVVKSQKARCIKTLKSLIFKNE